MPNFLYLSLIAGGVVLTVALVTMPFLRLLNYYFFNISKRKIFLLSVIVNFCYVGAMAVTILAGTEFATSLRRILNYYLGFLLYAFIVGAVFWLVFGLFKLVKRQHLLTTRKIGILAIIAFLSVNVLAIYNFERAIKVEKFTIISDKVTQDYIFVHISDIQFGSVSKAYLNKVLKLAAAQNPDFIVFTGDLIDFNSYKFSDFDYFKNISVPIYFERGNHEFYHFPAKILAYLQQTQPVVTLINQKATFGEIEIVGIDYDRQAKAQLSSKLKTITLDKDKFSILLFHEPKGIAIGVKKGFDLMLFGHTHAGQLWPITHLIDYLYQYGDGFYQVGTTKIYTTDDAALFGPKMRLGV